MIYVGIDVAKDTHWPCALDAGGRVLFNRAVRNTQVDLGRAAGLARSGTGRPGCGRFHRHLPPSPLLAEGLSLVHVPGLAVNRAAHGYPGGERKSDAQDARVIADLVRTRDGLRPIARQRTNVLWAMLTHDKPYNPNHRTA